MRRLVGLVLMALLLNAGVATARADPPSPPNVTTPDNVKALALRWYSQMQAGQLDRTQLTAAYSAQLTDNAVREMSHAVNLYGASPNGAQICKAAQ